MPGKPALTWSKLASAKWEDAWVERLQFLGPGRIAIFALPGSRRIRIEAYALDPRKANTLTKTFGGQVRPMKAPEAFLAAADPEPLLIRDRLVIVRSQKAAKLAAKKWPGRPLLIIPAAMAFGTGDHATTATCLRLLSDLAASADSPFHLLDLGAGTGILALAARLLGAARCDAWDFDPACVRAIRENAEANGLRNVPAARVDVTAWKPDRHWNIVTANLYSEVLVKVAPHVVSAVKPGGSLILSGMLAAQADSTLAVFGAAGIKFQRIIKKGKWTTALGTRPTALNSG